MQPPRHANDPLEASLSRKKKISKSFPDGELTMPLSWGHRSGLLHLDPSQNMHLDYKQSRYWLTLTKQQTNKIATSKMCKYLVAKILGATCRHEFTKSYEIGVKESGIIFIPLEKRMEKVIERKKWNPAPGSWIHSLSDSTPTKVLRKKASVTRQAMGPCRATAGRVRMCLL